MVLRTLETLVDCALSQVLANVLENFPKAGGRNGRSQGGLSVKAIDMGRSLLFAVFGIVYLFLIPGFA